MGNCSNFELIALGLNAAGLILAAISAYLTYLGVKFTRQCFRKATGVDKGS